MVSEPRHQAATRRLRVLMVAPNPFFVDRGFSVRVYEQARELMRLGHRVTVCAYHCGRDLPGFDIRRIPSVPWYTEDRVGASAHRLYLDALLLWVSLREAARVRPDVIHGHMHEGGLIAEIVGRALRLPKVFDFQGALVGELQEKGALGRRGPMLRLARWLEGKINRGADVVVASSAEMAEQLGAESGLGDRIRASMDGVNTHDFRPGLGGEPLRRSLGVPAGRKVVVYLGLLTPYQGVDCLLQAAAVLVRRYPRVHFVVMGYPGVDRYRAMAQSLGVGERVTFTGRVDYARAAEYIGMGDVAVSPKLSAAEGNGKLYNYMACGVPTVAFDTRVNREILGDCGIYARLGDADSLAESLLQALEDEGLARRLGRAGRARAVEYLSWERVAARLVECYDLAIRTHAPGRAR